MSFLIRYILLTAIRDRLFVGLLGSILVVLALATFLGGTALVEHSEMTRTLFGSASRMVLGIGLMIFVCFHVRRGFDNREIDVMLSRPLSRLTFITGYWMGMALVATLLVIPAAALVAWVNGINEGLLLWAWSLLLESWILVALSLFVSLMLSNATSAVLASLGFYILARMMGYFILTSESILAPRDTGGLIAAKTLTVVSMMIPRLDLFAQSEWLIYGLNNPISLLTLITLQAVAYIPLLLGCAWVDFRRRQF